MNKSIQVYDGDGQSPEVKFTTLTLEATKVLFDPPSYLGDGWLKIGGVSEATKHALSHVYHMKGLMQVYNRIVVGTEEIAKDIRIISMEAIEDKEYYEYRITFYPRNPDTIGEPVKGSKKKPLSKGQQKLMGALEVGKKVDVCTSQYVPEKGTNFHPVSYTTAQAYKGLAKRGLIKIHSEFWCGATVERVR